MTKPAQTIAGKNPVIEALHQNVPVEKIYIAHGLQDNKVRHIYKLARQHSIPIVTAEQHKLKQLAPDVVHQGVVAIIAPIPLITLEALLEHTHQLPQFHFIVLLDRIQDPHNLGAIIRSAEVLGAGGIIIPAREAAPITTTVIKTSAGAVFHLPIARVTNLATSIRVLKENGYWVYGSQMNASTLLWEADFRRKCAIIIGNEARGIRPGLLKTCDTVFAIPQRGKTESLNASVAAGIIFAEFLRQNFPT